MAATEIQGLIISLLAGNLNIQNNFPGGVYDRIPKAGKGANATPNAFYTEEENPLESGTLKPTIAVLDGGDVPAPAGEALAGYQSFPWVYAYVKPDATGDLALRQWEYTLRSLFRRDISYPYHDTTGIQIILLERAQVLDAEEIGYPGRLWTRWRLQATGIRLLSQV